MKIAGKVNPTGYKKEKTHPEGDEGDRTQEQELSKVQSPSSCSKP